MSTKLPVILIAPAAFKGTLSAFEAAAVMQECLQAQPASAHFRVNLCPIADGGDDTLAVVQAASAGYKRHQCRVTGPLPGMTVLADYLVHAGQKTVLIEAAQAHGLKLYPPGIAYQPMQATSYGVGELIRHAVRTHHPETLVVSLGGSASTDGGMGALQALGFRFWDAQGQCLPIPLGGGDLSAVVRVDWPEPDINNEESPIFPWQCLRIVTDVVNPLLGSNGSAAVYAPQKGASPAQCEQLAAGLQQIHHSMQRCMQQTLLTHSESHESWTDRCPDIDQLADWPGVGAAGGLAYGLRCLPHSEIVSGSAWVAAQLQLPKAVVESDIILTGEGCLDATSLSGKATGHLLQLASGKPVFFFCGQVREDWRGGETASVYSTAAACVELSVDPYIYPMVAPEASAAVQTSQIQGAMDDPKAALRQAMAVAWPTLERLLSTL